MKGDRKLASFLLDGNDNSSESLYEVRNEVNLKVAKEQNKQNWSEKKSCLKI